MKCEGKLYINCFLIGYNKSSDDEERKEGRKESDRRRKREHRKVKTIESKQIT